MRFSIIIPVYNVEKYIDKCMSTVMNQTFDDYEVIVVDDETPDNSMQIVQQYAERFPGKIQVIHQKNTRQGGARNRGVQAARGEYILFVDSDDYVSLEMLETVDARLKDNPVDILVFDHKAVTENGETVYEHVEKIPSGLYCPKKYPDIVFMSCAPWKKAFRRSFYIESGFQFPETMLYEDAVTRFLYAKASTVALYDDVLYFYVYRENSTMRQSVSEKMLDILSVTDLTIFYFQRAGLYEQFQKPLECALIYGIQHILDSVNALESGHPIQNSMADYIKAHFPDYRQNPWVSRELCRALDCILAHNFQKYHFRFLVLNRWKEQILRIPVLKKLNQWRKGITS